MGQPNSEKRRPREYLFPGFGDPGRQDDPKTPPKDHPPLDFLCFFIDLESTFGAQNDLGELLGSLEAKKTELLGLE